MRPGDRPRLAARCAALSFLVPGLGQLYVGERRRGLVMLAAAAVLLGLLTWRVGGVDSRGDLAARATDSRFLLTLLAVDVAFLALRLASIVDAYRLGRARRAAAATLGGLALLAAVPHVAVGVYAYRGYDAIETVFAAEEPGDVVAPTPIADAGGDGPVTLLPTIAGSSIVVHGPEGQPPWMQRGRLNVLLLGADQGPGRPGLRTDTMIVATIGVESERAALLSVPRNLAQVPLARAARAKGAPRVFVNPLNELYEYARENPNLFSGGHDPGTTALKQTVGQLVGLPIDYYVLVDFRGFFGLVDALGGIDLDVPEPVLDRVSPYEEGGDWIRIDLQPGRQHLDAAMTFAYVRARSQSSDYSRIERQRCVIAAIADQASPAKVLRSFGALAKTFSDSVSSDIPAGGLPAISRLAASIDPGEIVSIGFVPPEFDKASDGKGFPIPDVRKIRDAVANAIAAPVVTASTTVAGGACGGSS